MDPRAPELVAVDDLQGPAVHEVTIVRAKGVEGGVGRAGASGQARG